MADFTEDLQSLRPSFTFSDVDPSMELLNQFTSTLNPHTLGNSPHLNMQGFMPFCSDSFSSHRQPDFPGNYVNNFPCPPLHGNQNAVPLSHPFAIPDDVNELHNGRKRRKPMDMPETSCSGNSTPPISEAEFKMKNSSGKAKKVKSNKMEEEKPKEVVHVRARRGQATDSHSLAERVRRGKINEKLKCLRNIVPGCYKTMGMAVMLDEIINYVQSLQNQVEFLSMKLTAASTFYDFNSETDDLETLQRAKANETRELERLLREGYGGGCSFQTNWSL